MFATRSRPVSRAPRATPPAAARRRGPGWSRAALLAAAVALPPGGAEAVTFLLFEVEAGERFRDTRAGLPDTAAAPDATAGGGALGPVLREAADLWSAALPGPGLVAVEFGFAPLDGDRLGVATRNTARLGDGTQIPFGTVRFDATRSGPPGLGFFLDPTPGEHGEFGGAPGAVDAADATRRHTDVANAHGQTVRLNTARFFDRPSGAAVARYDLLTVALHEIAHVLGFGDPGVPVFDDATAPGGPGFDGAGLAITRPGIFEGLTLPTTPEGGGHLDLADALMAETLVPGRRVLPSDADILAVAELGGFPEVVLSGGSALATRVPLPPALAPFLLALAGLGAAAAGARRARRRP